MIREFTIENFKSIESLTLQLGQVTVLIGENGAGKSNVLEAMALYFAAAQDKLDSEFLHLRGVRDCLPSQTICALSRPLQHTWRKHSFHLSATHDGMRQAAHFLLSDAKQHEADSEGWAYFCGEPRADGDLIYVGLSRLEWRLLNRAINQIPKSSATKPAKESEELGEIVIRSIAEGRKQHRLGLRKLRPLTKSPFVIYSPENTALRTFEAEGQMRPLGVRGEGLFKLVQHFAEHQPAKFKMLRQELKLFDWFEDFAIPKRLGVGESRLEIKDRFLAAKRLLDQRSANEGFLFLLFYLCLFLSPQTPSFFAIDNIDASLNPKLCAEMMRRLVALAKQENKQVIITTHNPAILDGLDLTDKAQMLYAIQRDAKGRTQAQKIAAPKPQPGEPALKLSHAYLRGLLGGVPKNF